MKKIIRSPFRACPAIAGGLGGIKIKNANSLPHKRDRLFRGIGGKVLGCWFCLLLYFGSIAQTQALKQLQLDIEKLAQLKMQLQQMYKGYSILANGYTNIKSQSLANFVLHKEFIDALSTISPAVRNDPSVNAALLLFTQIQSEYHAAYQKVKTYNVFNSKEIDFFCKAYAKILSESNTKLDALQLVLTPNKLQMNESERLEMLATLKEDLEKQLSQLRNFTAQANQLQMMRNKNKNDNQLLRFRYGLAK